MARSTPRPAIPPLLKHMNERTVLEAIRSGAPISRAEISRRAGISKPTVSLALRSLLDTGLVREAEPAGRLSYGAVYFEPVPDAALVLGLDLGARFLRGAVCDLEGRAFADDLGERLGLAVTVENDTNLAALGEQWQGVARGVENFVFLSVGTGLGAGLVLRGELHRGQHGAAGELDYALVGLGQDVDPCAGAVSDLALRLAATDGSTVLREPFEPRAIFAAARAGDAVAQAVVHEEARRIALHILPV